MEFLQKSDARRKRSRACRFSRDEAVTLVTALSLSSCLRPCTDVLWNKLCRFMPKDIAKMGKGRIPDISQLLSKKEYKKYRKILDTIENQLA